MLPKFSRPKYRSPSGNWSPKAFSSFEPAAPIYRIDFLSTTRTQIFFRPIQLSDSILSFHSPLARSHSPPFDLNSFRVCLEEGKKKKITCFRFSYFRFEAVKNRQKEMRVCFCFVLRAFGERRETKKIKMVKENGGIKI